MQATHRLLPFVGQQYLRYALVRKARTASGPGQHFLNPQHFPALVCDDLRLEAVFQNNVQRIRVPRWLFLGPLLLGIKAAGGTQITQKLHHVIKRILAKTLLG